MRWVGNEDGVGRQDEWSVQPVFHRTLGSEATIADLGEEHYYEQSVGAVWYPNEVNTHVLNQWFWNEETSYVRPLKDLINIFYHSIGNNGTLLLNVSPDRHGVIPEDQICRLRELKEFMDGTFHVNLAEGAAAAASSESEGHSAAAALEENVHSWWSPDADDWDLERDTATLEITLPEARTFDNLLIKEYIRQGQRVAGWEAHAFVDGQWQRIAQKKTIGYKTIVRFPAVTTDRIRITILRSWDTPMISRVSLHMTHMPQTQDLRPYRLQSVSPLEAAPASLLPGLRYTLWQGGMQSAALVEEQNRPIVGSGVTEKAEIPACAPSQDYSLRLEGYLRVPYAHEVIFKLGSADGSILYLNGQRIIDNDEPHDYAEQVATVQLDRGLYHLKLLYTSFRHPGKLKLLMSNPAFELVEIMPRALGCDAE